jgi:rubredoxin
MRNGITFRCEKCEYEKMLSEGDFRVLVAEQRAAGKDSHAPIELECPRCAGKMRSKLKEGGRQE